MKYRRWWMRRLVDMYCSPEFVPQRDRSLPTRPPGQTDSIDSVVNLDDLRRMLNNSSPSPTSTLLPPPPPTASTGVTELAPSASVFQLWDTAANGAPPPPRFPIIPLFHLGLIGAKIINFVVQHEKESSKSGSHCLSSIND